MKRQRNRTRFSADEEATLWQLAGITGRPAGEIARIAQRSYLAQAQFHMVVMLATSEWEYLDGITGQWGSNPEKQASYLRRYAALLVGNEPPT